MHINHINQYGFREGRNVQQAVIKATNFISKEAAIRHHKSHPPHLRGANLGLFGTTNLPPLIFVVPIWGYSAPHVVPNSLNMAPQK